VGGAFDNETIRFEPQQAPISKACSDRMMQKDYQRFKRSSYANTLAPDQIIHAVRA
jgi:hypothetical protein